MHDSHLKIILIFLILGLGKAHHYIYYTNNKQINKLFLLRPVTF